MHGFNIKPWLSHVQVKPGTKVRCWYRAKAEVFLIEVLASEYRRKTRNSPTQVMPLMLAQVLRLNHIGDWGTQFGMLIQHINELNQGNGASGEESVSDLMELYRCVQLEFNLKLLLCNSLAANVKCAMGLKFAVLKPRSFWAGLFWSEMVQACNFAILHIRFQSSRSGLCKLWPNL